MLKIPVQLTKRMGDGPTGEMRFQIEIPDSYIKKAIELDLYKQQYFVLMGPFEDEGEILNVIQDSIE